MTFQRAPPREGGFELLNNLPAATDGAVQALQVAIDDENQIVQFFAGGESDAAQGLRARRFRHRLGRPGPWRPLPVSGRDLRGSGCNVPDRWPSTGSSPWRRWEHSQKSGMSQDADRKTARHRVLVRGEKFSSCRAERRPSREGIARTCRARRGPGSKRCRLRIRQCGRGRNG